MDRRFGGSRLSGGELATFEKRPAGVDFLGEDARRKREGKESEAPHVKKPPVGYDS